MAENLEKKYLCEKLKNLREKNGFSQQDLAEKLGVSNKSTISRVESGSISSKNLEYYTNEYCRAFGMSEKQIALFKRIEKIVIPDTSALLKNPQLIEELNNDYSKVIIPNIVIKELNHKKDTNSGALGKKAWEILCGISYGERVILREYQDTNINLKNDLKIIEIAKKAIDEFRCSIDIITNDIDYSVHLKNNEDIKAVHLREYTFTKQKLTDMVTFLKVRDTYQDSYDDVDVPEDINAYDSEGNTLIISAVLNKKNNFHQRKAKIKWLIKNGADINKKDCNRHYFPPISHSVQINDYEMFKFLLTECKANPNIGSRNPYDSGKVRQKNEGNMPLMIAAWHNRINFIKLLCDDSRTSINQQDSNGFTALIKAMFHGHLEARDILLKSGADTKIVDINGYNYVDHYNQYLESDRGSDNDRRKNKKYKNR